MSRALGDAAEARVAGYLAGQGYEILARNYAVRGAEVDIIARDGDYYVFVEVKYRKDGGFSTPREAVTHAKRRRVCMAALLWLQAQGLADVIVRFDVAEVSPGGVTLLRGAFDYVAW